MSKPLELRPAGDILRVVDSFSEARELLDLLSDCEIGGICIKGITKGLADMYLEAYAELYDFAQEATLYTQGLVFGDSTLRIRRQPLQNSSQNIGKVTVFGNDIGMHFDGYFEEVFDGNGDLEQVTSRHPLIGRDLYGGVSHHLTRRGSTTFVMERLSSNRVTMLARNQQRGDLGVLDTNPLIMPIQGEALLLEEGDYLALHSYAVYRHPVYVHGTINSSPDRYSVAYNPVAIERIWNIDELEKFQRIGSVALQNFDVDNLPVRVL